MANLDELIDFLSDVRQKIDNLDLSNRSQIDTKIIEKFQGVRTQLKYAGNNAAIANRLRECLFELRQQANQIRPVATNVDYLKKAIHTALVELARQFPLNKINEKGELLCPLSGSPLGKRIALSNGYHYQTKKIKEQARITHNKPYFPQLGNVSQYDVDEFHGGGRSGKVEKSVILGMLFIFAEMAILAVMESLSNLFLGMKALSVVHSAVMAATGLAMGATVAGIATGLVLLPFIATIAYFVGKAIYGTYQLDKKYSSTLEPDKSTNKMLDVLDGTPSRERQNLEVDQNTNDKNDVLVPLVAAQGARNDVELSVAHEKQQLVEDNAATTRTYSVY